MSPWFSYLLILVYLMLSMTANALRFPRLQRRTLRMASASSSTVNPKVFSDANLRYSLKKEALSGLPDLTKPFTVLGIESSCDDTGVAIVRSDGTVVSNVVYSQYDIHRKFGGIVPSLAMEQHKLNIDVAVDEALKQSGLKMEDIDAVAVTQGPGLEVCLRVGLRKAQAIATEYKKPFVTVHHLEAHCMMARLAGQIPEIKFVDAQNTEKASAVPISPPIKSTVASTLPHFTPKIDFPFLVLLASGGHTSLLVCRELGDYTVLGGTLDDALGEAFDKAARLLGLQGATSGGVAIERAAAQYQTYMRSTGGDKSNCSVRTALEEALDLRTAEGEWRPSGLSVPMKDKTNCHFSYAGLKTQFRNSVEVARATQGYSDSDYMASNAPTSTMAAVPENLVTLPENMTNKLCFDFQNTAFGHVEDRLKHALNYVDHEKIPVTSLIVVGGVAANKELRRRLWALLRVRSARLQGASSSPSSSTPLRDISLVFPPPKLCTDNGVMVAWTGVEKLSRGISNRIEGLDVIPRWPIGTPLTEQDNAVMNSLKKGGHKNRNERKADRVVEAAALKRLLDQIVVL